MRVIIAGGGTGGHLFPAVALGEELKRECAGVEVMHVGASNGIEARWLPQSGLKYELFEVRGLTGKDPLTRLRAMAEFIRAIGRARSLLKEFRADLVVSAGGYASAPMAVAAVITRTPMVLMEQNTRPGLTNRMTWRFARKVCVGFADSQRFFGTGKVEVTGNPVRLRFIPGEPKTAAQLQILVLGGSSGAHRLNLGVIGAFKIWNNRVINLSVVHQTGEADAGLVQGAYRDLGLDGRVCPFIEDMAGAIDQAHLVVARAGAMTVSEVALAGRPAIFVPYPFHRDRQQELNALVIERIGGAVIVHDDDHLAENLAATMRELTADPARLIEMGKKARTAVFPDAAARIARVCFEVAGAADGAVA